MKGKRVVITGPTPGIGKEIAAQGRTSGKEYEACCRVRRWWPRS